MRDIDRMDDEIMREFLEKGCGCCLNNQGPCISAFTLQHLKEMRNTCKEMDREILDSVILGQIMAMRQRGKCCRGTDRQRASNKHYHEGVQVSKIFSNTLLYYVRCVKKPFCFCMVLERNNSIQFAIPMINMELS
jgi:hypothetical protein